jgi:hypothetical protein
MKKIPEKFHRYLVFGNWLCERLQSSPDDVKRIQELFNINASADAQILFYTKFHEDYLLIDKKMSSKNKKTKRDDNEIVSSDGCDNIEMKKIKLLEHHIEVETTNPFEEQDNDDYLWQMDDDFHFIIKETV